MVWSWSPHGPSTIFQNMLAFYALGNGPIPPKGLPYLPFHLFQLELFCPSFHLSYHAPSLERPSHTTFLPTCIPFISLKLLCSELHLPLHLVLFSPPTRLRAKTSMARYVCYWAHYLTYYMGSAGLKINVKSMNYYCLYIQWCYYLA